MSSKYDALIKLMQEFPDLPLYLAVTDHAGCESLFEIEPSAVVANITNSSGKEFKALLLDVGDLPDGPYDGIDDSVCPICGASVTQTGDQDNGFDELSVFWRCDGCGVTGTSKYDTTDGNRCIEHEVDYPDDTP